MSKNILFITSYFPPAGGVGVQRLVKFCKYLSRDGIQTHVLTPPAWSVKRTKDSSMLSEIPANTKLITPGFIDIRRLIPGEIAKYLRAWERKYLFPDNIVQWVDKVLPLLPGIISEHRIDLAFITLPHFSLMKFASVLQQQSVPVILDLRDPFSFNYYSKQVQDKVYQQRVSELEHQAFSAAEVILNVTQEIHGTYLTLYPQFHDKFKYLPNGFDDEDFPELITEVNLLSCKNLSFCYAGSYSSMASIMPYRDAILSIFNKYGIRMHLNLVTPNQKRKVRRDFSKLFSSNLISYHGFLPHREAINRLLLNHVLLYPCPGFFSGKIYEYLRADRPVLCAITDEKDSHQLIREAGVGIFANLHQPNALENILMELQEQWQSKSLSISPNWEFISTFSASNRAEQLKQLINKILK